MINESPISLSISKEQLLALPIVNYAGQIVVADTIPIALEALDYLKKQPIVGFDTETRPSFKKGHINTVSLIQIATHQQCFLFRINKLGFFDELKSFLKNGGITKIGLSLKDDFIMLHRISDFNPNGFIDLQSYVKDYHITDCSLQKIYGIIFNERISKSQRLSNWEADSLTPSQQTYASIDAWACLRIYNHLEAGLFDPYNSPYITTEQLSYNE